MFPHKVELMDASPRGESNGNPWHLLENLDLPLLVDLNPALLA